MHHPQLDSISTNCALLHAQLKTRYPFSRRVCVVELRDRSSNILAGPAFLLPWGLVHIVPGRSILGSPIPIDPFTYLSLSSS